MKSKLEREHDKKQKKMIMKLQRKGIYDIKKAIIQDVLDMAKRKNA